jgi:hypothetical protein
MASSLVMKKPRPIYGTMSLSRPIRRPTRYRATRNGAFGPIPPSSTRNGGIAVNDYSLSWWDRRPACHFSAVPRCAGPWRHAFFMNVIVLRVENCEIVKSSYEADTVMPAQVGSRSFSAFVLLFPGSRIKSGMTLSPRDLRWNR